MRCARHPDTETSLSCGKCGQPICPKCMVQTPVGARCPECARVHKLPTYRVTTKYYLRAIGAATGVAIAGGLLWGFINIWSPFNLNLLLAPAAGYAIGEVVSRAVNRKRSQGLAAIGGIAVVLSYIISHPLLSGFPFFSFNLLYLLIDLAALGLGIWVAVSALR